MGIGSAGDCVRRLSSRELEVCRRFGVVPEPGRGLRMAADGVLPRPGTITLVTGPSGAGKTSLLGALALARHDAILVGETAFPGDVSVLDAVAPGRPLVEALRCLTACSLGEPRLWLRRIDALSEGERFRARLARALSMRIAGGPSLLLCDEFGSILHRRLAQAIAFNLWKLVRREGLALVVATAHEDLDADLSPACIIRLSRDRETRIERPSRSVGAAAPLPSWAGRLRVEPGSVADYRALASLHYRHRDGIGCAGQVFVLRDVDTSKLLGVVMYGHSPLELSLRNQATGGRFVRKAGRLNAEMRILRRLVIHPDVRGCGLGHWLVSQTLPWVGTPYVECLAAMGLVNPVFEKAGMRRIGICQPPARQERVLQRLEEMGVDALSAEFGVEVSRRPSVRHLVAKAVFDWYRGGVHGAADRVLRQSPSALARTFQQLMGSQPVYYLWSREG